MGDRLAGRNPRLLFDKDGNPTVDANKLIAVPNYFLFDASLGYACDRFPVRFKMANLLNELSCNLHDDNSVNPHRPPHVLGHAGLQAVKAEQPNSTLRAESIPAQL